MKEKSTKVDDFSEVCDSPREEDGAPVRRRSRKSRKPNHSSQRLCKQAHQALDLALVLDVADPALEDTSIREVRPVSGSQALEVVVSVPNVDPQLLDEAHAALSAADGVLRASLAAAITRKRVPALRFRVIGMEKS
ncbi:MAG: hypothetical protein AAF585_27230 [Verrucomicrobiota bacterium]